MKKFLRFTSIVEAITGIGLFLIPVTLISILFGSPLTSTNGIILARIAGAAIFSLAILCFSLQGEKGMVTALKILVVYNLLLTLIFAFGLFQHELQGAGAWLVLVFHLFQTLAGIVIQKRTSHEQT